MRNNPTGARLLAHALSLSLALQPIFLSMAWAEDDVPSFTFESSAQEGQSFGSSHLPSGMDGFNSNFNTSVTGGDGSPGSAFSMEDEASVPDASSIFGSVHDEGMPDADALSTTSEDAATSLGADTARSLNSEGGESLNPSAAAFGIGQRAANSPRIDMRDDPAFRASENIFKAIDDPSLAMSLCGDSVLGDGETVQCQRDTGSSQSCDLTHNYEAGLLEHVSGPMNVSSCGAGCAEVWLGQTGDNYYSDQGKGCHIYNEDIMFRVLHPEAITSAAITYVEYDDHLQIYLERYGAAGEAGSGYDIDSGAVGALDKVYESPFGWNEAGWSGGAMSCERTSSHNLNLNLDVTSYLKDNTNNSLVSLKTRTAVGGNGESYALMRINYDPTKVIRSDGWTPSFCADQALEPGRSVTCTDMPSQSSPGCVTMGEIEICEADFPSSASGLEGISPLCRSANVSSGEGGSGGGSCAVTVDNRDDCAFVGSVCVDERADGSCAKTEETYQCGGSTGSFDCSLIDDLPDAFDQCTPEYEVVENGTETTYRVKEERVCNRVSKLTECEMERDVTVNEATMAPTGSAQCIGTEVFQYQAPQWRTTFKGFSDLNVTTSNHVSASITSPPTIENDWTTTVTATGPRQNYSESAEGLYTHSTYYCPSGYSLHDDSCRAAAVDEDGDVIVDAEGDTVYNYVAKEEEQHFTCSHLDSTIPGFGGENVNGWSLSGSTCSRTYSSCKTPTDPQLNFGIEYEGLYLSQNFDHFPADDGINQCLRNSDDWTSAEWTCLDDAPRSLPSPWGGTELIGASQLPLLEYLYDDIQYQSPHTVSEATSDQRGRWCWRGHAKYNPDTDHAEFWLGKGPEFTDIYGDTQAFEQNDPEALQYDSCEALENDSQCTLVRESCTGDATGITGFCYVDTLVYDCGEDVTVSDFDIQMTNTCEGVIACSGEDCFDYEPEGSTNEDFAKTASLLHAAEQMANDMSCTGVGEDGVPTGTENVECQVFKGEANECKTPLGGVVHDCCDNPVGISLGAYLGAVMAIPKLDAGIMSLEGGSGVSGGIKGAYTTLRDPVTSGFSQITSPFTSAAETISGTVDVVTTSVQDFASNVAGTLKDQMSSLLSDTAAGGVSDTITKEAAGSFTDTIMGSGGGQLLSTLSAAYTAYTMAVLAIQLIWECEESEFQLSVDKDLKKCTHVGDYCNKDAPFGSCVEKREAYCCFSSPLSRIIQEQGRPQLGMGWGSAKNPSCEGLTVEQVASLDWDSIDLGEWIGMLEQENLMPNAFNIDTESTTGVGSVFDADGARHNAESRTQERIDGIDIDNIREDQSRNMALPGY